MPSVCAADRSEPYKLQSVPSLVAAHATQMDPTAIDRVQPLQLWLLAQRPCRDRGQCDTPGRTSRLVLDTCILKLTLAPWCCPSEQTVRCKPSKLTFRRHGSSVQGTLDFEFLPTNPGRLRTNVLRRFEWCRCARNVTDSPNRKRQTQRYLNITDDELRKAMTGVWERRRQLRKITG
jgi:hypothetical protein